MAQFRRSRRFDLEEETRLERELAQTHAASLQVSELADACERYALHPGLFVHETFAWGMAHAHTDESQGPLPWQEDVLGRLEECLAEDTPVHRLAISAGKGVGKTSLASWLFLWHAGCHHGRSHTVCTAVTGFQAQTRIWREITIWHALWKYRIYFKMQTQRMVHTENSAWYGMYQTWNEKHTEGFQGIHERHAFFIVDEASGVSSDVLDVIEDGATGMNVIILYISNPTRTTGAFVDCFRRYKELWHTWQVDARTVPLVSRQSIATQLKKANGDEDAASFRMNVRGLFPLEGHDQTIPERFITAACERFTQLPALLPRDRVVIGVDLARRPGDKTVFVVRQNAWVYETVIHEREEPEETAERLAVLIQQYYDPLRAVLVFVSGAGHSQRVVDLCGAHRGRVQLVEGAGQALHKKWYADRRSELWYLMRQWLKDTGHLSTTDAALLDELQNTFYGYDDVHRVCVESQDTIRERGLPTPNIAESLANTFAGDDQFATQLQGVDLQRGFQGTTRRSPVHGIAGNQHIFASDLDETSVHPAFANRVEQRFDMKGWERDKREYADMLYAEAEKKRKEAYQKRRKEEWGLD